VVVKIYVASSWRNENQPKVVSVLRNAGHEVYDFRNPEPGDHGFHWSWIDPKWMSWTSAQFRYCLGHPLAKDGFGKDFDAMKNAELFVLVSPCGRSAHLELGWAVGAGKKTIILLDEGCEPELMYKLAEYICINIGEVIEAIKECGS